ncbi:hypothetical protein E2C01_081742 [Portunus trituberculatus]|uniref:Uncharacterized protein n=1 Tax=Portunus trituberculatus TaxID=210409 RepID=A0A5B7ISN7_PORTR|nr:hypothetical protein [Portunus trituberculatus]
MEQVLGGCGDRDAAWPRENDTRNGDQRTECCGTTKAVVQTCDAWGAAWKGIAARDSAVGEGTRVARPAVPGVQDPILGGQVITGE